nr:MAG TPA: hypothetical protein [Bacteriophage sp.]
MRYNFRTLLIRTYLIVYLSIEDLSIRNLE